MSYTVYRHGKPAYRKRAAQESAFEAVLTLVAVFASIVALLFV